MTIELIRDQVVKEKPGNLSLAGLEAAKDAKLGDAPPLEAKQCIVMVTAKIISTLVAANSH